MCRHFCVCVTYITLGSISSIQQFHDRGTVIITVVVITVLCMRELRPKRG